VLLPSEHLDAIGLSFSPAFGALSHASAYGLQSLCLRLTQVVTSLHSRLDTSEWVTLSRSPFQAIDNKAPRGAPRWTGLKDMQDKIKTKSR